MPKTIEELEKELETTKAQHQGVILQKDAVIEEQHSTIETLKKETEELKKGLEGFQKEKREKLETEFHSLPLAEASKKIYTPEYVSKMPNESLTEIIKFYQNEQHSFEEKHTTAPNRSTTLPNSGSQLNGKEKTIFDRI